MPPNAIDSPAKKHLKSLTFLPKKPVVPRCPLKRYHVLDISMGMAHPEDIGRWTITCVKGSNPEAGDSACPKWQAEELSAEIKAKTSQTFHASHTVFMIIIASSSLPFIPSAHVAKDEFLIVWRLDLVNDDCNELALQIEELEEILKELPPINPTDFSDFSPRHSTDSGDRSSQLTASTSSPLKGKGKRKAKTTVKESPEQTRKRKEPFGESSRHSWLNNNASK
ncbi:hypothetical protein BDQ12DRAFT_668794 [Crucibulum laeve]|uniref:Uncharacterized protein n=1 Tax=Crucibulum laeve TaxID=68775 RepID=A0A5C3LR93_9AGAR|nr:hypothetical protein BDQ12DRAFT_668794 [Crucibulum laeve]